MSWIKNKFNKLFKGSEQNDDYDYEVDYEDDASQSIPQGHGLQQDGYEEIQPPKKTFRFPLIDDDATSNETSATQPVESQTTNYYDEDQQRLSLPNHLQKRPKNEVLDVEVAGIRELLERRRKGKGHSNVIRTAEPVRTVSITKEERQVLTENLKREENPVNKEFTNPLENRKRFVPTKVPSPVHGFLKPTPIEELIEKSIVSRTEPQEPMKQTIPVQPTVAVEQTQAKQLVTDVQKQTAEKLDEQAETFEQYVEPLVEVAEQEQGQEQEPEQEPEQEQQEQQFTHKMPILFEEELEQAATEEIVVASQVEPSQEIAILLEDEQQAAPTAQELLNDVQVKHVTIENSTIHIGQLNVEQLPQQEQQKVFEQAQQMAPTFVQREKSGSRLPFNVLMLKSDKQKLLTKQFVAQQMKKYAPSIEQDANAVEALIDNEPSAPIVDQSVTELAIEKTVAPYEEARTVVNVGEQTTVVQSAVQPTTAAQVLNEPQMSAIGLLEREEQPISEAMLFDTLQMKKTSRIAPLTVETFDDKADEQQASVVEEVMEEAVEETSEQPVEDGVQIVDETTEASIEVVEEDVMQQAPTSFDEAAVVQECAELLEQVAAQPMTGVEEIAQQPIEEVIENDMEETEGNVEIVTLAQPSEQEIMVEQPVLAEPLEPVVEAPIKKRAPYVKPPLEYLVPPEEMIEDREWMDEQGENLVEALSYFQIQAHIESIVQGPAVTQFEITVGHGTKVSKVRNLADDIKLALAAKDIRIDAPIPGKRSIGIEIPNRISRSVRLSEVTESESFHKSDSPLEAALGLDLTGKPVTIDLRKMPHGLIAGATGSGKSVCINSILVSLLYKANPSELKLMLIDPKMVELAPFNHIPHLVSPVITDVKAATAALKWAVDEMERRYQLFMHSGARKIEAYNKMCDDKGMYAQKLPYLLIVIDELADLMMMSPQDVEDSIVRITQKARAAGIHLIVATQRPSVDVITGLIKSNIPTRIAFSVSSQIDSRTILDSQGAERLLGRGDMLYLGNGMSAPTRIQGTFVTDEEIEEIIDFVREQGEPEYIFKQEELLKRSETVEEQDELFEEVCRFVYEQRSASTSLLQRKYKIGYNRAARLIDMLEQQGYVSEPKGSKPRDVFITAEDLAVQFGD